MTTLAESVRLALGLMAGFDAHLFGIVALSLRVSIASTLCATVIGLPIGAALAVRTFRGRGAIVATLNALMGMPPVVMGLLVYLMLSRAGPLGSLGLLFTPGAMVIAQTLLIAPIVAALSRQVIEDLWAEYSEQLRSLGSGRTKSVGTLLWDGRFSLVTVVLAGFGRAAAEVGAIIIVGGNIDGFTRTMTTTIALETSKGDLPRAIALGGVLVGIIVIVNALAWSTQRLGARFSGA